MLPCAQRRSRAATSSSDGGLSSQLPPSVGSMRTDHPARRSSAASTKSCDRIAPPNGFLPGSTGKPAAAANARTRMIALWPQ